MGMEVGEGEREAKERSKGSGTGKRGREKKAKKNCRADGRNTWDDGRSNQKAIKKQAILFPKN